MHKYSSKKGKSTRVFGFRIGTRQKPIIEYSSMNFDLESDLMASSRLVDKLRRRAVKNFLDILILTELEEKTLSGYDVIALIHRKFNILVSSGTIYSLLYSLERDGLIEGIWNQRKRIYKLTEKGARNSGLVMKANQELHSFMKNISLLDAGNHH